MTDDADKSGKPLLRAMRAAQQLAFGPLLFQAARSLRDRGILSALHKASPRGLTASEISERCKTSVYGVTVLVEAGLAAELVEKEGEHFRLTTTGYLVDKDPMTRVNMNFVDDVCYRAAAHLDEAIETGGPSGLCELGPWATIYEGLLQLPEPARTSWLDFDHFYSDDSFPQILKEVFAKGPSKILDVGGNTGKFALALLGHNPDVHVTVADLPGQIAACRANLVVAGFESRAHFHEFSILDKEAALPRDHDVIWMSQFLSCFSEQEVVHNLSVARRAMSAGSRLLIMDNLWDRQKNPIASLCLQATSLYFTVVANGTSRMYDGVTLVRLIGEAGLRVVNERDGIGWGHSIIECALPG